jgi:hypothetical protein
MPLKTRSSTWRACGHSGFAPARVVSGCSIVDHPAIAPQINTVAKTYELAHIPEHLD